MEYIVYEDYIDLRDGKTGNPLAAWQISIWENHGVLKVILKMAK